MGKFGWSYPPGAASDPNAPYNQTDYVIEDAIAEHDLVCPACQEPALWFRELEQAGFPNELLDDEVTAEGWRCDNCEWEQECVEDDHKRLLEYQEKTQPRIDAVRKAIDDCVCKPASSIDDIFGDFCPEGDFEWKQEEAGDWHVYNCGESDCSQQWHLSAPYTNLGRKDGKRWIEIGTCEDGDWDVSAEWHEGEDFTEVGTDLANQLDDYFKGWAKYWLDCADTGRDPCDQIIGARPADWTEFCIKAAEENAKYLAPTLKKKE